MFDFAVANRDLHHMLFYEAGASEAEALEPLVDVVTRVLESAIASGAIRPGSRGSLRPSSSPDCMRRRFHRFTTGGSLFRS
jgi:hypothetical protein